MKNKNINSKRGNKQHQFILDQIKWRKKERKLRRRKKTKEGKSVRSVQRDNISEQEMEYRQR